MLLKESWIFLGSFISPFSGEIISSPKWKWMEDEWCSGSIFVSRGVYVIYYIYMLLFPEIMANQPPPLTYPPRNQGLIAGHIKGNQWTNGFHKPWS